MNNQIIDSVPLVGCVEVSVNMPDWEARFLELAQQRKSIKFDLFTMPAIPGNIESELIGQGYIQQILKTDHSQRFLVPPGR